jgi:hypothetical protein
LWPLLSGANKTNPRTEIPIGLDNGGNGNNITVQGIIMNPWKVVRGRIGRGERVELTCLPALDRNSPREFLAGSLLPQSDHQLHATAEPQNRLWLRLPLQPLGRPHRTCGCSQCSPLSIFSFLFLIFYHYISTREKRERMK